MVIIMKKRQRRLEKVQEEKPLSGPTIWDIPIEFWLITVIMVCVFILILICMGPCTDSGLWFNNPLA